MAKGKPIQYSADELAFVEAHKHLPRLELTKRFNVQFGRTLRVSNIKSLCTRKGWSTGRTGCFEKGETPWNKGVTGYMGANATSFRKGNLPHNTRPMFSERVSKDGFIEIKVREHKTAEKPNTFELKHRWLWEQAHGPVPEKHVLIFVDGDRTNCTLDNLKLAPRHILTRLNQAFPGIEPETKATALRVVELQQKLREVA